jgi:hypothetical protein
MRLSIKPNKDFDNGINQNFTKVNEQPPTCIDRLIASEQGNNFLLGIFMLKEATSLVNWGHWLTKNLAFRFKSSKLANQIVKGCDKLCHI